MLSACCMRKRRKCGKMTISPFVSPKQREEFQRGKSTKAFTYNLGQPCLSCNHFKFHHTYSALLQKSSLLHLQYAGFFFFCSGKVFLLFYYLKIVTIEAVIKCQLIPVCLFFLALVNFCFAVAVVAVTCWSLIATA